MKIPPPPPFARARELLDLTWYFLRSTDGIMTFIRTEISFMPVAFHGDTNYWIELSVDTERKWEIKLRGWVPSEFILPNESEKCISIAATKIISRKNHHSYLKDTIFDGQPTDVFLDGMVTPDDEMVHAVVQKILAL